MKYTITIQDDPEEGALSVKVDPPLERDHITPAAIAAYIGFKAIEEVAPKVLDDMTELFRA